MTFNRIKNLDRIGKDIGTMTWLRDRKRHYLSDNGIKNFVAKDMARDDQLAGLQPNRRVIWNITLLLIKSRHQEQMMLRTRISMVTAPETEHLFVILGPSINPLLRCRECEHKMVQACFVKMQRVSSKELLHESAKAQIQKQRSAIGSRA